MRSVLALVLLGALALPAAAAPGQTAADKAAARQITSHLQQSGQLKNYRIGVTYKDGIATLSGSVASPEQRETAIRLAEQVSGVSQVVSRLQCGNDTSGAAASNDSEPRSLSKAFADMQQASAAPSQPSAVMQAHLPTQSATAQQARMQPRPAAPRNQPRQMPRNNMPLPAPRQGMHPGMNPAIQQTSAQGVIPASGIHPPVGPMGHGRPGVLGGGHGILGGGHGMHGGMGMPPGPGYGGPGAMCPPDGGMGMQPAPMGFVPEAHGRGPSYENAQMPAYAWPSYASYPNYAALSYPRQYSPTAWPYIGPFYPYPQVPLAWRKVSLEWDDGWWFLDFSAHNSSH